MITNLIHVFLLPLLVGAFGALSVPLTPNSNILAPPPVKNHCNMCSYANTPFRMIFQSNNNFDLKGVVAPLPPSAGAPAAICTM